MAREYIPIFFDWLEVTQDLTQEQKGNLIDAAVLYASGGDYQSAMTGVEIIAFRFIKGQIDRNNAISDARSKAGSNKKDQNETNENKTEQNGSNSPKEKENKNNKDNKKENDNLFDRFWSAYPRKVAKPAARKKFDSLNPDEQLLEKMILAVERQKQSDQWMKDGGQFIPHPATWLNQRRWEDETPVIRQKILPAQDFYQRDYSEVPGQMMEDLARNLSDWEKNKEVG